MRRHLADDAPLQCRLRVDLLTGPQQPLRASRADDLLPDDVQPVPARDAEGRMGLVAVRRPLRSDVDVREEQVFRVHGRRPVRDADDGQRQLEQPLEHLGALDADLLPTAGLKISPRLGPSIWSMNESPVPVITSASLSRSSDTCSSAAGNSS